MARFNVYFVQATDFFEDCSVPLHVWVERGEGTHLLCEDPWREVIADAYAAMTHPRWQRRVRDMPHVAYDVVNDQHYFIFKFEHGGDTLIVSQAEIAGIERIAKT